MSLILLKLNRVKQFNHKKFKRDSNLVYFNRHCLLFTLIDIVYFETNHWNESIDFDTHKN